MFLRPKQPSELQSETILKIYNKITELQADISKLKGEQERLEQNLKSLRGKVNRESFNDDDKPNEKAFIGLGATTQ